MKLEKGDVTSNGEVTVTPVAAYSEGISIGASTMSLHTAEMAASDADAVTVSGATHRGARPHVPHVTSARELP